MSIAAAAATHNAVAADKDRKFEVGAASSYASRQTNGGVTVAAKVYDSEEDVKNAFGKSDPNKSGVLPVLVVIQNDSKQALHVDTIKVEYMTPDRDRVEATPAQDIRYLRGARRPNVVPGPLPTGGKISRGKNPPESWEIEGRAFSAKMIPPGQSASGFFYFQTGRRTGSKLYVTGITEAGTGKEIFYYEIDLVRGK